MYLKKSIQIYKIYGIGLLFTLFTIIVLKPLFPNYDFILDFFIGIHILIMIVLAPTGLFYIWKSYQFKEQKSSKRIKYLIGHLVFTLFTLGFIVIITKDVLSVL